MIPLFPKTKKQILWEKIYYYRGHGLSQSDIAKRVGLTQQAVCYQLRRMRKQFLQQEVIQEASND